MLLSGRLLPKAQLDQMRTTVAGNGRAVGVAVTTQPGATAKERMGDVVDAALCAR